MLLEQRSGRARLVEARTDFGSSTPPTWAQMQGSVTSSGQIVGSNVAVTVPTIVGAIQLIAGAAAALPIIVYEGLGDEKQPQYESWQYRILETFPSLYSDPFQLKYDIFWHLETHGNAFVLKMKSGVNQLDELMLLDPDAVRIRNEGGAKLFDVRTAANTYFKGATVNEVLHIKNLPKAGSLFTGTCGIKLITARLGAELSATEWEGRFFQNDATPPLVITLGDDAGVDEMREAYESWQHTHAGPYNAGKPAILGGGAKVEKLGFNLHEAQLIEAHGFNVLEFCRAMNVPLTFFIPPHTKPAAAEDEALVLQTFYVGPRLRRVESAFNSDPDFFAYNDLWMRFDERASVRANTTAQALANHAYVQDGVLLPDEVRADLGYGPLPPIPMGDDAIQHPGQIPQITPVGGAPNDPSVGDALTKAVTAKSDDESNR